MGKSIEMNFGSPRVGDIKKSMLCNQEAVNKLGWFPNVDLAVGVERTINYFKANFR